MRAATPSAPRRSGEHGVVLLLALIALLLISAVGAAILYMAASESGFVGAQRMTTRLFYAAEAGLEEARFRLQSATQPVPEGGINFSSTPGMGFPAPVYPCTATEVQPGTVVPCNTVADPARYPARPENVLYILNTAPAAPVPSNPGAPASETNDPLLANEITNPIIATTPSIQPGAGTANSVPYSWVRINLKTELASGQDLNFDGVATDENPVFLYEDRQYTLPDLLNFDPTGSLLPPPWGPPPPVGSGKACVADACASPVYMLTAYSTVGGPTPSGHLVRTEVAAVLSYTLNAAIYSVPPIRVSGTSEYIGYDGCNPACPTGPPGPGLPCEAPPGCNFVVPLQTQDNTGQTDIQGSSSRTWPHEDAGSGCPNPCPPPNEIGNKSCIQKSVAPPYDINKLIQSYLPADVTLPAGNYTGLTMGVFPFNDPSGGSDAVEQVTHVTGDFKCTGGCSGSGVLIVDGDLEFNASMEFFGLVLVRGNVTVLGGGSPTTGCNLYGAVLAGGAVETKVGGTICFWYNSCALSGNSRKRPILQLSFRSVMD